MIADSAVDYQFADISEASLYLLHNITVESARQFIADFKLVSKAENYFETSSANGILDRRC